MSSSSSQSLGRMEAEGATALFDAVMFSLTELDQAPGRRALVVLSDGDDRDSRYAPKDVSALARALGAPIYVIGLGRLDTLRRILPERELRRITGETGGRLFIVHALEELENAYTTIERELRSQYTLRFYAPAELTADERNTLAVRSSRPGVAVRTIPAVD